MCRTGQGFFYFFVIYTGGTPIKTPETLETPIANRKSGGFPAYRHEYQYTYLLTVGSFSLYEYRRATTYVYYATIIGTHYFKIMVANKGTLNFSQT